MKEIISYFLKIGLLGFGGPMAHITMMDEELVEKRKWLDKRQFLDALALCNMLPGPASTQLGIYMGYIRGGVFGGLASGICFILPAFTMMVILSYMYFNYGTTPVIKGIVYGINAVALALVANSLLKMRKKAIVDYYGYIVLVISALAIYFLKANLMLVMIGAGVVGVLFYGNSGGSVRLNSMLIVAVAGVPATLDRLILFFLKVGAFIYGGGLVIIPFIEREVVENFGWMTSSEFITGLSFGQVTPGPVVITSAFIGYKVMGMFGAFVAAVAIFAPSFAFIMIMAPYLERVKHVKWVRYFLTSVNAAVIGMILAAFLTLIPSAIVDGLTAVVALAAFVAVYRYKTNVFLVVFMGGLIGFLVKTVL